MQRKKVYEPLFILVSSHLHIVADIWGKASMHALQSQLRQDERD